MPHDDLSGMEQRLDARPEFRWLTRSTEQWFNVTEVARQSGLSRPTITKWCEEGLIPGSVYYGQDIGWRMPRSGLIEFFDKRMRGGSAIQAG